MLSEVKHLVVHRAFRRMGLARSMLSGALASIETPVIFATIRSDNVPSLSLFASFGFTAYYKVDMGNHQTTLLLKANEHFKTPKIKTKASLF